MIVIVIIIIIAKNKQTNKQTFPFIKMISCALLGTYYCHVPYTWLQTSWSVYMRRLHGWVTPCYFVGGPTERCCTSPRWFRPGEKKTGDRGPSAEHGNNLRGSCRYVSSEITCSFYRGFVSAHTFYMQLLVYLIIYISQGLKFMSQLFWFSWVHSKHLAMRKQFLGCLKYVIMF